jgi:hypothetical protein
MCRHTLYMSSLLPKVPMVDTTPAAPLSTSRQAACGSSASPCSGDGRRRQGGDSSPLLDSLLPWTRCSLGAGTMLLSQQLAR